MRITRKVLCTMLLAALLLATAAPALAVGVPKNATFYRTSATLSDWNRDFLYIDDIDANTAITNVKSGRRTVMKVQGVIRSIEHEAYVDGPTYSYGTAAIRLAIGKPGSATLSMKVDGTAYKTAVKVLKYVNPIKTFVITGLGNTNLKSRFAKEAWLCDEMDADAAAGTLKLAAASGWKIVKVIWEDEANDDLFSVTRNKGVSSIQLPIPAMSKETNYCFTVYFKNKKTGGIVEIEYYLQNQPGE